jgi:hypothetical protein
VRTVEETLALIDELPLEKTIQNRLKFLLVSQEIDDMRQDYATHRDLETLKLQLTIRFGVIAAAAVGVLATLDKLL